MSTIALVGLFKMVTPEHTVLLCDGAFQRFDGDLYMSKDGLYGVISGLEAPEYGVGDQIPAISIDFAPAGNASVADLIQPGFQGSPMTFWVAQYDMDTGEIVGTPDVEFLGFLDRGRLSVGRDSRTLTIGGVPLTERMLTLNIGNSMNPNWHKSIWAGETGHDQATGLTQSVAWGTASIAGEASALPGSGAYSEPKKVKKSKNG